MGKRVTLTRVRKLFDKAFGKDAGSHVELRCKQGMITEIWLHLGRGENLKTMLKEGRKVHSRCQRGVLQ
jgi:ribonuclease T2